MLRNERKFKRRCLVCRNYFLQKEMFRIRKQDATFLGQWASPVVTVLSPHSLCQGRSAYLCSSQACWVKIPLQKGRLLSQALRTQLSSQALESLMETLQNPPPPKNTPFKIKRGANAHDCKNKSLRTRKRIKYPQ